MSITEALMKYINQNEIRVVEKLLFFNNKGKKIFASLLLSADENNVSTLSYNELTSITELSKTTLVKLLEDLEKEGLITRSYILGSNTQYKINYNEEVQ